MKPILIYPDKIGVYILVFLIGIILSCKDKITNPPDDYPPGYQHDIPWPSLADSPWPMNHGNPQNTGRSKLNGPQIGRVKKIIYTDFEVGSGAAVDKKYNIYFTSSGNPLLKAGLHKYDIKNDSLRQIISKITYHTTPLVNNEGTIYYLAYNELYAIDIDENIVWIFTTPEGLKAVTRSLNIGKNGYIYFLTTKSTLFCVDKFGNEVWRNRNSDFYWHSDLFPVFSEDGDKIYITGSNTAIKSVNSLTGVIEWEFGSRPEFASMSPLVDSYGNIYILSNKIDTTSMEQIYFCSLTKQGKIRWKFPIYKAIEYSPTIDKNGTISLANDTLYSIKYDGTLNYKLSLNGSIGTDLVCDQNGTVFLFIDSQNLLGKAISNDGKVLWSIEQPIYGFVGGSPTLLDKIIVLSTNNYKNLYIIE
jgi:hypothetical protein